MDSETRQAVSNDVLFLLNHDLAVRELLEGLCKETVYYHRSDIVDEIVERDEFLERIATEVYQNVLLEGDADGQQKKASRIDIKELQENVSSRLAENRSLASDIAQHIIDNLDPSGRTTEAFVISALALDNRLAGKIAESLARNEKIVDQLVSEVLKQREDAIIERLEQRLFDRLADRLGQGLSRLLKTSPDAPPQKP